MSEILSSLMTLLLGVSARVEFSHLESLSLLKRSFDSLLSCDGLCDGSSWESFAEVLLERGEAEVVLSLLVGLFVISANTY